MNPNAPHSDSEDDLERIEAWMDGHPSFHVIDNALTALHDELEDLPGDPFAAAVMPHVARAIAALDAMIPTGEGVPEVSPL